jgi:hypothetical protein
MGVIEAKARWTWRERDAPFSMSRYEWRALLGRSVNVDSDSLTMPMELLGRIGVVVNLDGRLTTFFEAQKRPGKLPVVSNGGDYSLGRHLNSRRLDVHRVVERTLVLLGKIGTESPIESARPKNPDAG